MQCPEGSQPSGRFFELLRLCVCAAKNRRESEEMVCVGAYAPTHTISSAYFQYG